VNAGFVQRIKAVNSVHIQVEE